MTIQPGDIIGPYEVKERLGEGGMAAVFKAWHGGLHRHEALKIPRGGNADASYVQRLLAEARLAAGLRHPHIVAIHNVSEPSAPIPFFAMEWIEGQDLLQWLKASGRLSLDETIRLLEPVASALDYAHSKGVIHRDVKPANILLQQNPGGPPTPKVVDFGISRAADDDDGATRLTRSGMFVGTPEYMSPEQSGSGEEVGHSTDIYALGVLAYEMICGTPPFTVGSGVSRLAILVQHVRDMPPSPAHRVAGIPTAAGDVVLRALAKTPAERYATCSQFIQDLKEAVLHASPPELDENLGETGTILIPAPPVGGLLVPPPATPPTGEMSPFDATRFGVDDVATIMDRPLPQIAAPASPGGTRHNVAAPIVTKEHVVSEPTLQFRVPAAQQRAAVANEVVVPTPAPQVAVATEPAAAIPAPLVQEPVVRERLKAEKTNARPVFAPSSLEDNGVPPVKTAPAGRKTALLAALGGGVAGALLVMSLMGRPANIPPEAISGATAQASDAPEKPPVRVAEKSPVLAALPVTRTEFRRRMEAIPFTSVTQKSDSLPEGERKVLRPGREGQKEVRLAVTLQGKKELSRKVASQRVVREPQQEVVLLGTQDPTPRMAERPRTRTVERPRVRTRNAEITRPRVRVTETAPRKRLTRVVTSAPRRRETRRAAKPAAPRRARRVFREAPLPP